MACFFSIIKLAIGLFFIYLSSFITSQKRVSNICYPIRSSLSSRLVKIISIFGSISCRYGSWCCVCNFHYHFFIMPSKIRNYIFLVKTSNSRKKNQGFLPTLGSIFRSIVGRMRCWPCRAELAMRVIFKDILQRTQALTRCPIQYLLLSWF